LRWAIFGSSNPKVPIDVKKLDTRALFKESTDNGPP